MGTTCSQHRKLPLHIIGRQEFVEKSFADNPEWLSVSYYVVSSYVIIDTLHINISTESLDISSNSMKDIEWIDFGTHKWTYVDDEFVDTTTLGTDYINVCDRFINGFTVKVKKEPDMQPKLIIFRYLKTDYR